MKKIKTIYLALAVIIAAGLLVRLWGIAQGGYAFTYDAGRDLLAVRDLVAGTKFSLIGPTSGQMGVFYGPWYYWILAIPFVLFRGNPTYMVGFVAVLGVAASVLAFWWGRRTYGDIFAIVFSAMLAVSPVFVGSTNQLWSPHLIVPVMVAIIVLWSRIGTLSTIGLLGLGFLVGFLDELEVVYGVVFTAGFFLALLVWQRKTLLSRKGVWIATGALFTEIPRILFELRHQFLQTKALLSFAGGAGLGWSRLRPHFLWDQLVAILPEGPGWVRVVLAGTIASLVVLYIRDTGGKEDTGSKGRKRFLMELFTVVVVFVLFTLFYGQDVWPYYLIGLPVILALSIALAFSYLGKFLTPAITAVLVFTFLFLVAKPVEFIVQAINPPFVGDAAVYRNQQQAIQYIYTEAGDSNFNLIAYTPPQIEYTWRYLSWWTKQDRQYGEVTEKQPVLYVIVEPDYGYPQRVREWLWARADDGEVIKQLMFNSGIIVQTRRRTMNKEL